MARIRFVGDQNTIVLVSEQSDGEKNSGANSTARDGGDLASAAPFRMEIDQTRSTTDQDAERWGAIALLTPEELTRLTVRCLNAALSIDQEDLATASQALEILVSQQLSKVDADNPVSLMEEAMRYVLRQERWMFEIVREERADGVLLALENPNGEEVPLGVHVSNRGKTPSFWVMQQSRLVQGSHAYKIPIQAATSLKQAVSDYIAQHDTGAIHPFG